MFPVTQMPGNDHHAFTGGQGLLKMLISGKDGVTFFFCMRYGGNAQELYQSFTKMLENATQEYLSFRESGSRMRHPRQAKISVGVIIGASDNEATESKSEVAEPFPKTQGSGAGDALDITRNTCEG